MRERTRWYALLGALAWVLLIFGTSSTLILPRQFFDWLGENVFKGSQGLDRFKVFWSHGWILIVKGWHAAEFAILFCLVRAMIERFSGKRSIRDTILSAAFCVLFAMSDEYHQTFVPGRGGNWRDVAIDAGGVFAGWFTYRRRGNRPEPGGRGS